METGTTLEAIALVGSAETPEASVVHVDDAMLFVDVVLAIDGVP